MTVYILKTDESSDDVRICDVYEDEEDARRAFERILSEWWPEECNRCSEDYNGRTYDECIEDMVYSAPYDGDCIVVEAFDIVPSSRKVA